MTVDHYHLLPADLRRHPTGEPRADWHARIEVARQQLEIDRLRRGGFNAIAPDTLGLSFGAVGTLHRLLSWLSPGRDTFCAGTQEMRAAVGVTLTDLMAAVEELAGAGYIEVLERGRGKGKGRTLWVIRLLGAAAIDGVSS